MHLAYNIHLPVSDVAYSVRLACASIRATPAMQVSAGAHASSQVSTHIHTHKMLRNRHRSHTSAGCVVEATGRADLVVLEANARAELRTRALTAELDDLRTSAERASMRNANQHGPTTMHVLTCARCGGACARRSALRCSPRPHACIGAHRSQQCGGVTGAQAAAERMRLEREINTLREQHRLLAEEKMRYRPAGVLFISAARMRANAEAKACGGAALCLIESAVVTTSAAAIRDDAGSASPRGCCVTAKNGTIPLHVHIIRARNRWTEEAVDKIANSGAGIRLGSARLGSAWLEQKKPEPCRRAFRARA